MNTETVEKIKVMPRQNSKWLTGFYIGVWLFYLFMVSWTFYMLGVQKDYQQIIYPSIVWHNNNYNFYLLMIFLLWLMTVIGAFYVTIKQIGTKLIRGFYTLSAILLLLVGIGLLPPSLALVINNRLYPEKSLKVQEINYLAVAHTIPADSGDYYINYAIYDCGRELLTCSLLAESPRSLHSSAQIQSFEYHAETNRFIVTWRDNETSGIIEYSLNTIPPENGDK